MSEFREKLTLLLIDKALLGLVFACFGLYASHLLERAKGDNTFRHEVARVQLAKLEETWKALSDYEGIVFSWRDEVLSLERLPASFRKPASERKALSKKKADDARRAREHFFDRWEENGLYINPEEFDRLRLHYARVKILEDAERDALVGLHRSPFADSLAEEIAHELYARRPTIEELRDRVLTNAGR